MLTDEESARFYDIIAHQENYYNAYWRMKTDRRGRVKKRKIIAPNDDYKAIQELILQELKAADRFPIHPAGYAWKEGVSREDCATQFVDSRYILEMDISDYFGSVTDWHLLELFNRHGLTSLAGLSTADIIRFATVPKDNGVRMLAQGFKTSPYLANCVRRPIDMLLSELAYREGLAYASYGDNLFFAGSSIDRHGIEQYTIDILGSYRFEINTKKTRLMPYYRRQTVLGIVVNRKLNVSKEYTNGVIRQVLECLKEHRPLDNHIKGKMNVLRLCSNRRNYNFINKLAKLAEEQSNNGRAEEERAERTAQVQQG